MDYRRPDAWKDLAERLVRRQVPQPSSACGRVACEPGWSWRPTLTDYDLWLVLSGRGRAFLCGAEISLRAGTLVVLRPGDTGVFTQDPTDRLTVVYSHFDFVDPTTRLRTHVPEGWLPSRHIPVADVANVGESMQRVVRLARDPHPLRRLERSSAFFAVLIEVYLQDARAQGHPATFLDPRLHDVIDFVRDHPHRRPMLEEAAAVAGLSASYLSRLFTRQVGMSFRHFVLEARMERAHSLLTETTMTISEISRALGYNDVFLFSRQFRRHRGQPPSHVRRSS